MNVSLTPVLEKFVHGKVKSGRYNSASEVMREALRLLLDRDRIRELQAREIRRKIEAGLASLDRGEGVDGDGFFAALRRRAEERKRNGK